MLLRKRSIQEIPLRGKRVFMRVDFNVPLDAQGRVTDNTRIRASVPTIRYAMDSGAKVILASHLGRPAGTPQPTYSLEPVSAQLAELLGQDVMMAGDCVGPAVESLVARMQEGDALLLENLRFHAGEVDIGPQTLATFTQAISAAHTIVWNGPLGVCEIQAFAEGTRAIARAVASAQATTIVGGGDTVAAVNQAGVAERLTHISTGGGAFLELLAGRELPGITALMDQPTTASHG